MRRVIWTVCLLLLLALTLSGCGRFRSADFGGKKAVSETVTPPKDLPKQAILEWGPPEAKVRVLAFFFISKDPPYPSLMQTLQDEVKKYPGKLYVKYADIRTQEGSGLRSRTGSSGGGIGFLINGKSEISLNGQPYPRTVNFDQDMNRYWTKDDLVAAIAQTVAQTYGKK